MTSLKTPLEESLNSLDLQATLVLMNLLAVRALGLQQDDLRKTKVQQLINPDTKGILKDTTRAFQKTTKR